MNDDSDPRLVELRLLRTFLVLMQERGVSRAAVRLNLSQPTMSHALARLRRLFNDPLLVNTHGAMTPTARGTEIYAEVEEIVARFDRLLVTDDRFDPATCQMKFPIMAPEFVVDLIAPPLMRRLQQEAPSLEVEFIALDPTRAAEFLEQGVVDFRMGWWPEPAPSMRHKVLWIERLVCIARAGNEQVGSPISSDEYFRSRHVRIRRPGRSFSMMMIDAAAARMGERVRVSAWVESSLAMASTVAQTDLIGTLSEGLAAHLSHLPLKVSALPIDVPDLRVAIYWHERTHRHPAHQWFRTLMFDVARQIERARASPS